MNQILKRQTSRSHYGSKAPAVEIFYDYFKKLNAGDEDEININEICDNPVYDEILNGKITELEITEAIRELKNNKVPGTDNILNEYLKYASPWLISLYCKVFNLVIDSGIIPESWSSGIFKPDNFRTITLISCVGKLLLQSPCPSVRPSVCPSVRPSVCPSVRPSVCPSVRSHFRNRYLSFYWKK